MCLRAERRETNCCFTPTRALITGQLVHIWRSYLARLRYSQVSAVSPRTQVKRIPSTDWEETFPWICFSRRNVTTTLMRLHLNKQALCGPHRRRQSCRFGPLSLFVVGCLDNKNVVYFFLRLPVRPLSPFFSFSSSTTRPTLRDENSRNLSGGSGRRNYRDTGDVSQRQVNSDKDIASESVFQSKSIF